MYIEVRFESYGKGYIVRVEEINEKMAVKEINYALKELNTQLTYGKGSDVQT